MAEVLLKIGPGANYEDGDILCAFNNRRIRCVHAEDLCHVMKMGFNASGRRPKGCLAEDAQAIVYQYKFVRIGDTIERTDLITNEVTILSKIPNEKGEAIDVDQYIRRRVKHARHKIFGDEGSEVWYGGRIDVSNEKMDLVWARITHHTGKTEDDDGMRLWPMGRLDIRHHLAVRAADFSEEEAQGLVQPYYEHDDDLNPILDENGAPIIKGKRNLKVDWRTELLDVIGVTEAQVLDKNFPVGRDVEVSLGKWRHESKDHPNQGAKSKLYSKTRKGPLPEA